jgi:hypothetical protein
MPGAHGWDLLQFIGQFNSTASPRIDTGRIVRGHDISLIRLRDERDISAFLIALPQSPP